MSDFIARQVRNIVSSALAPLEAGAKRLLGSAGIGVIVVACLIAAIAFLSIALDAWLAHLLGSALAALVVAGFYLLVAVIAVILLRLRAAKPAAAPQPQPIDQHEAPPASTNLDEVLAPFVAILHESGLKREEVAMRLGTEAAKQFGPFALVAIALAAGFLLERSFNESKSSQ